MEQLQRLIERIKFNLESAKEEGVLNADASWFSQEGVLLDYKDAQLIVDFLNKKEVKLGTWVKITDNKSGHDFEIGEKVMIVAKQREMYIANKIGECNIDGENSWYLGDVDFEVI